jgi:hypothetical protein
MPSTTGIELSPDSCVLVRARPVRSGIQVTAVHALGRMEWPTQELAIADLLRTVRRRKRFPRRARVVVWGLPEDLPPDNPIVKASVKAVVAAGFHVEAVMSPPQALAALARTRQRGTDKATAWLALNMQGAAIAIVRGTELLYSRTFDWAYRPDVVGTRAELLQRYSLVAHLAPEVRHGMSVVRASHGVSVDTAVTCGDLPELRSLTMPLIEELDLEVETLDSTEGLASRSRSRLDRFVESAPALRLACAAAIAPLTARRIFVSRPWRIAAAVALVAAGAWAALRYWDNSATPTSPARSTQSAGATQTSTPSSTPAPATAVAGAPSAPSPTASVGLVPPPAAPPVAVTPPPEKTTAPVAQLGQAQPTSRLSDRTRLSTGTASGSDVPAVSPPPISRPAVPRREAPTTGSAPALPAPAPASFAMPVQVVEKERKPEPLKAPIPVIDSILIAHDRRLAIIGGAIVGIGDSVGPRVVVAIDKDSVVFREPSGFELRVSLRAGPGRP